jgi:hypothetical protein
MPNWCSNYAEITGSKEAIAKIKEDIDSIKSDSEPSVFKTLVGIHPQVTKKEYDSGGWYDANWDFWGTKWDVDIDDCNFDFYEEGFTMSPKTAWDPPIGFYKALANKYGVNVEATYEESLNDFAGKYTIDTDGNQSDECLPYLEGMYKFDFDHFLHEIEYQFEEGEITEESLREAFPFVSEEDMEFIIEQYIKQD